MNVVQCQKTGEMKKTQGTSAQTSSWECKTAIDPEAWIDYLGENFNLISFHPVSISQLWQQLVP